VLPEADFLKIQIPHNVSAETFNALLRQAEAASCVNINFTMFGLPDSAYMSVMFLFLFVYISSCFKEADSDNR
jgi:hypothetical protein